jgi:hypothetical protein
MAIAPQYGVGIPINQYNTQIPMSVQYGVTPSNTFIPIKVNASGEIVIGGVTITGPISISDVTIQGVDPADGNSTHEVAVVNFGPDGYPFRSAIFDHANQLKINADGSINVASSALGPIGLKNIANVQINPATENTLAAIKTQTDLLSFTGTRLNVDAILSSPIDTDDDSIASGQTLPLGIHLLYAFNGSIWERAQQSANGLFVDGSGVVQPISATSLPLPTGAATQATLAGLRTDFNAVDFATEATLSAIKLDLDEIALDTDNLDVALSTRASESTLAAIKIDADKFTFAATRLLVDGSGVTQPVSATSLPLPTGAATSANQTNGSQKTKVVGDSGNPITSTTVGPKEALDVNVTNTGTVPVSSSNVTSVVGSLSSTMLLAANSDRKMAMVVNESSDNAANLYLKFGTTASTSSYTILIPPGGYYEFPVPIWPGQVDGIWSTSASATARLTELT